MAEGAEFWESFPHDPRSPEFAVLRASDADRDVVLRALGEAYADGRLDAEEYDERAGLVAAAKTLGEFPGLLSDLILPTPPGAGLRRADRAALQERAERKVRQQRKQAWTGFVTWSLICWFLWLWFDHDFPWPIFITVAGLGMALRSSHDMAGKTAEELHRLERKAARKKLE